ncbi:hypothetical protein IFT48_03290 [Pseudomonas fluorescens]|nr:MULTISPECIES: hypothetical protein [Pseudomonas]MBD8088993.1 hypothetical protein [Pseudomonas fluorescens]MBD8615576.1 hypothetical protein [Pseudomonas putida]MBD8681772.1 hypothetical protein [Pseudomonas sp. CFBP 13719]
MIALTNKAEVDLQALFDLYPDACDALNQIEVLLQDPSLGINGVVPDTREFLLSGTLFAAVYTKLQGWIIVLRILPQRFIQKSAP